MSDVFLYPLLSEVVLKRTIYKSIRKLPNTQNGNKKKSSINVGPILRLYWMKILKPVKIGIWKKNNNNRDPYITNIIIQNIICQ